MKKQALFIIGLIFAFGFQSKAANADADKVLPSASTIMKRVWSNMEWETFTMTGILRTRDERYPLTLKTKPYAMEYELTDPFQQIRVLHQSQGSHVLNRSHVRENWETLPSSQWNQAILRTDLTYEELALDFLSWPKIERVGTDSFKTEPAFVLDSFPEKKSTIYSKVRFWISQQHYVLMRADFYNSKNQVAKRIEVNGVQKIGSNWFLKELQISTRFLDRDLSRSRTYLEIQKVLNDET